MTPDRAPGHQFDQAERLAIADLRLTRHLAKIAERKREAQARKEEPSCPPTTSP